MSPYSLPLRNTPFPFLAIFNALFADLVYSGASVILGGAGLSWIFFGVLEVVAGLMAIGVAVVLWKGFVWADKALLCFYGYLFLVVAYYYVFLEKEVNSSEMYVVMFGGYWFFSGLMIAYVYSKARQVS